MSSHLTEKIIKNDTVRLFGLPFLNLPSDQVASRLLELGMTEDVPLIVFTPNPEQIVLSASNSSFREQLSSGDVFLADGVGISLAAKIRGKRVHRNPGRVIVVQMLEHCADKSLPVLFLGGKPGVSDKAFLKLKHHLPRLRGGAMTGPDQVEKETDQQFAEVISHIEQLEIEVLLVGFGAPHQEAWCNRHRNELRTAGVRVVMTVGGVFDVLAGEVSEPPVFISSIGVEWLWRLIHQPWRWKRQLRLLVFLGLIWTGYRVTR